MPRVVHSPVALFSFVALLIAVPILVSLSSKGPLAAPQGQMSTTTKRAALIRAGLGAEALAAAGLTSQQASTLVGHGESLLAGEPTRLSAADAAYSSARVTKDALERKIQSGLATQEEVASFASASSALASAEADRAAALASLVDAATASLSEGQRALLSTMHSNRERGLSPAFLTVNRTDAEWLALRNALSNEVISARNGDEANATCQSLLSTVRANETVAAAKSAHDANLATVTSAWDSATSD